MKTLTTNILTFKDALNNLILTAQVEGKSDKTIHTYNFVLLPFYQFAKKEPDEVTVSDIRLYLNHLQQKGYAKTTIWTHYKELKVFFNFCYSEGHISNNPMQLIKKPRVDKLLPKTLTNDEVLALLRAAKASKGFLGKRNAALIALLFDSGLRASEVCGLKLTDVSLENQIVRVFGKGSKERVIPFSKATAKLLLGYLKARGKQPFEEAFFVTHRGNSFNRNALCHLIKKLARKANISADKVSPHVLRHTFATSWIKAGGDAKRLQHMLGHADPRVVDVYVHLTAKDLSQAHSEFSPLNSLKNGY